MQIPKQLITKLEENIDERIRKFFEQYRKKRDFDCCSMYEAIELVLSEALTEELPDIRSILTYQNKTRKTKKKRWADSVREKAKGSDPSTKKNPFHKYYIQADMLTPEQFDILYHVDTVDCLIGNILREIDQWAADNDSLFIEYPLFLDEKDSVIQKNFLSDLLVNCLQVIMTDFDGNINQFIKQKAEIFMDTPIFSPNAFRVPLDVNEKDGQITASVLTGPGKLTMYIDGAQVSGHVKTFDEKDDSILSALLSFITKDFYESKTLIVSVGALAKILYPGINPSKNQYDDIVARIHRMALVRYQYEETDLEAGKITYGFLDTAQDIVIAGKRMIQVTFGQILYDSILKEQTVGVTRYTYEQLESSLSKLLYPALQRERINLTIQKRTVSQTDNRLVGEYNQMFFARIILFNPTKQRARNMKMIQESLNEFVEKKIAIESFTMLDRSTIRIFFFPLNDDERIDFRVDTDANLDIPLELPNAGSKRFLN